MTGAELRDEALRRVDEDPAHPRHYTAAQALAAVGEAEQLLAFLSLCLEGDATVSLAAGVGVFFGSEASPRWICPLRIRAGSAKLTPATIEQLAAFNRSWRADSGAAPLRYAMVGPDLVFVHPKPTPNPVNLTVTYARMPAALLAGNSPEVPEVYHRALLDFAVPRLRVQEGGQALESEMPRLNQFLEAAGMLAGFVRARNQSRGYDKLPPELNSRDMTRVVEVIRRGARAESDRRG